jgi:hypothetical protein
VKLKIISDGTAHGTRIVNADTGEEVEGVVSVFWEVSTDDELAYAELKFLALPVEVVGDFTK